MDGPKYNEIKYSKLFSNNNIFRLDSEFFDKESMFINEKITNSPHFYLKQNEVVSGPFGSALKSDSYLDKGDIPFVRIENIRGGFDINADNIVYISNSDNERIINSQLKTNDIVLSKVGNSIGYFARVDESIEKCNISENNIGIKLSEYSEIEKHYILTYLNCFYAQKLVLRRASGNAQPKLNVGDLCYIPIPKFSSEFYERISIAIKRSRALILESRSSFSRVEDIFLKGVKFDSEQLKNDGTAEKLLSESLTMSGRLDAEYYQPKYDDLFKVFSNYHCEKLGGTDGLVTIKKSIEPGSDVYQEEGIPFVRVGDMNIFGIEDPQIKLPGDIVPNVQSLFPQKDTILLSKDGSIGLAYKVDKPLQVITSGALLHLTIKDAKKILPDYLTLVLNSPIVQLQAERDVNGAVIPHWKPAEIENVLIPILDMDIQKEIAEKVQHSFALRRESKRLLDLAVKAVEMAIETDEQTASQWLESQI